MRILVISTLSDLQDGILPALKAAGHDLVAVVPSVEKARMRSDLAGFALFEGETSCPGDWQQLIEGAEVILHLAYSTPDASESQFEPRHVLRADSVFQTVEAMQRIDLKPVMLIIATGSSTSLADPSDASLIREHLGKIAGKVEEHQVMLRFIQSPQAEAILSELSERIMPKADAGTPKPEQASSGEISHRCLALPLDAVLDPACAAGTEELLHEISRGGCNIVLFTSSGMSQVLRHRESLTFSRYVILGDGAALLDFRKEEMIRTELLEPELLQELVASARSVSPRLSFFSERGMNLISDGSIPPLAEAVGILGDAKDTLEGSLFERPATRLFIQGSPPWVGRVQQLFSEGWWKSGVIALLDYQPGLLGVLAPTADRSIALQRVESLLDVPRRSSVVFVSSPLDAGMLEIYTETWSFGPFSEVIGRHATRCFSPTSPLFDLLKDFLAQTAAG
jgi:hydroxymethylpyrimidine pyrophosphatase-like HAD family hydrolase